MVTAKKKGADGVVKIDGVLLEKINEFISLPENRLRFVNKKQFIDLAVDRYLREEMK
jgi:hypothetical protein